MSHYFDHAATTRMRPSAISAWSEQARALGNPSAVHGAGRAARKVVEDSREVIASALMVDPVEVIFTSGGTEADNMAVLGTARARRADDGRRDTVLVSSIEHHAVLDSAYSLVDEGFTVLEIPVDPQGVVDLESTRQLVAEHGDRIAVAACMWVNNETGVIQPVGQVAGIMAERSIPYHCDAVQAGLVWTRPDAASLALSAHKLGGPMGVGALILTREAELRPIAFGGGQERKLRSGTVPVPLVASFAQAVRESAENREEERARLARFSARLESILTTAGAEILGGARTPAITYALFPGCSAQDLLVLLDQQEIFVSTGSACAAGVVQPSHVLLAMGRSAEEALTGLRFSLGWSTTEEDLDALDAVLGSAVARARRI